MIPFFKKWGPALALTGAIGGVFAGGRYWQAHMTSISVLCNRLLQIESIFIEEHPDRTKEIFYPGSHGTCP